MKFRSEKGYTVIELLTVAGVMVIIGGVLTGIIVSTLRGTNKTQTSNAIAQNGNYALSVISNILVSSDAIIALRDSSGVILDQDGDCTSQPNPIGNEIDLRRIDGGITTLACDNQTIASESASMSVSLLDTTKVRIDTSSLSTCYFKCIQEEDDPYSAPSIEVGFVLTSQNQSGAIENTGTADFKTSVKLRNYAP